jgi:hypothetical protein
MERIARRVLVHFVRFWLGQFFLLLVRRLCVDGIQQLRDLLGRFDWTDFVVALQTRLSHVLHCFTEEVSLVPFNHLNKNCH